MLRMRDRFNFNDDETSNVITDTNDIVCDMNNNEKNENNEKLLASISENLINDINAKTNAFIAANDNCIHPCTVNDRDDNNDVSHIETRIANIEAMLDDYYALAYSNVSSITRDTIKRIHDWIRKIYPYAIRENPASYDAIIKVFEIMNNAYEKNKFGETFDIICQTIRTFDAGKIYDIIEKNKKHDFTLCDIFDSIVRNTTYVLA